jgi:hypothetical protein
MSKPVIAFNDLIASLRAIPWLSVYTEVGQAGGRALSLVVSRGDSLFPPFIGGRKVINGYILTLTTPGKTAPADLSERLGVIDDVITADRRRGSSALTTIMADEGWAIGEDEGRESFSISTTLQIHINEAK